MSVSSEQDALNAEKSTLSFEPSVNGLRQYFADGATRSVHWRQEQLTQLKRLLENHTEQFLGALNADLGKSDTEAWIAEIGFLLADIKHTLTHLKGWSERRRVSTPLTAQPGQSYIQPEPLGVVLIIGAWNYPVQLILSPAVAALAAGNCVVLKPSELSPACSALIAALIPQYLDKRAVMVAEGGREETQQLLSLQWDHIFYTGGAQVAKHVMAAAAQQLTPVTLELGGKSPCIVDESCNIEITARRIVWGKWMNCGQTCIAPDYVLVTHSQADALLSALKSELHQQYGKTPLQNKDYGKIINQRHLYRLTSMLDGLNLFCGGQVDAAKCKLAPTILRNPPLNSLLMEEEIFGPILPVITVPDTAEAIKFINARPKPLALYLFSKNEELHDAVVNKTSAGSVCINDTLMFMSNPKLPFGGVGQSGMGKYHGKTGFDTFSHIKSVMVRSFKLDPRFRYAPFSRWKLWLLKAFL